MLWYKGWLETRFRFLFLSRYPILDRWSRAEHQDSSPASRPWNGSSILRFFFIRDAGLPGRA